MAMQQEPIEIGGTYCWSMSCSVGDLPEKSVNFFNWVRVRAPTSLFLDSARAGRPKENKF